jgi:peptidoglycan/LPS O-acetylase OafA/YrhL
LRRPRIVIALALAIAAANTLYVLLAGVQPWTQWINEGGAIRALPAFFLGTSLFLFRAQVARIPVSLLLLPALLVFVFVGWAFPDWIALGLIYLVAIAAVHCDLTAAPSILARLRIGRWAHLTYSSYMLHMPVATFVVTVAGRVVVPHWRGAPFLLVALAMVILAFVSAASFRLFEDPLRKRLNAAFDRWRRPPVVPLATTPRRIS